MTIGAQAFQIFEPGAVAIIHAADARRVMVNLKTGQTNLIAELLNRIHLAALTEQSTVLANERGLLSLG